MTVSKASSPRLGWPGSGTGESGVVRGELGLGGPGKSPRLGMSLSHSRDTVFSLKVGLLLGPDSNTLR